MPLRIPILALSICAVYAAAAAAQPVMPLPDQLTLMRLIELGGAILWIILGLGFVALVMSLYFLLSLTPRREVPMKLVTRVTAQLARGEVREAYRMLERRPELIACVMRAGLKKAGHDRFVVQEAMAGEGERRAALLWQRIAYINNIATLTPLLGLLGTVWGMILAFGAIAGDPAQTRDISMASSVALAMITTAGGLIVAIPALFVYYFLRGRVTRIIAAAEGEASELVELLAEAKRP